MSRSNTHKTLVTDTHRDEETGKQTILLSNIISNKYLLPEFASYFHLHLFHLRNESSFKSYFYSAERKF